MKFEGGFHELFKKRRQLRDDLLDRTGKDWNQIKKEEKEEEEKEETERSLDDFLTSIESGDIIANFSIQENETDPNADIKDKLREMDKFAGEFDGKNKEQVRELRDSFVGEKAERNEQKKFEQVSLEFLALKKLEEIQIRKEFWIAQDRKGKITEIDRERLGNIAKVRGAIEKRKEKLWQNPETMQFARMHELRDVQTELREFGLAPTKQNRKDMEWIRSKWESGNAVLLEGPTGTGKTELFIYLIKKLYGKNPEIVRCTERTGPAEIFGKVLLRAKSGLDSEEIRRKNEEIESMLSEWRRENLEAKPEDVLMANARFAQLVAKSIGEGTETYFQSGRYTEAIDKGIPNIYDEFNQLPTNMRFALKELYNRKAGDLVKIQEDSGKEHVIQKGFAFGATANIKSEKYKERFEFDDAESRVFSMRHIDYLSAEEMYDVCLAKMMDQNGGAPLSFREANVVLKNLVDVATEIQRGYKEELQNHYGMSGSRGKKPQLEKAVLDPGQILGILEGFEVEQAKGKSFQDFLDDRISDFVGKRDYPNSDRELMIRIFMSKGFLQNIKSDEFSVVGLTEEKLKSLRKKQKESKKEKKYITLKELSELDPYNVRKKAFAGVGAEFMAPSEGEGGKQEGGMEGGLEQQIEQAKEILGEEYIIGPEVSKELFDQEFKNTPLITDFFTQEELQQVRQRRENGELNERLIFIPADQTIQSVQNALKEKADTEEMKATGGLRSINQDIKTNHFSTQKTEGKWVLVSEPLEETQNKTAPVQLKISIEKLQAMHQNNLPQKYQEAVEKFNKNFPEKLQIILDQSIQGKTNQEVDDLIHAISDSEKRTQLTDWLASEEIAKLITPNFAEFFTVFALRYQTAQTEEEKEQLQKDYKDYSRIYQKVESECLAHAGNLDSGGVQLVIWYPDYRIDYGVLSFSRS